MKIRLLILLPLILAPFVQTSCNRSAQKEEALNKELAKRELHAELRKAQEAVKEEARAEAAKAEAEARWRVLFDGSSMKHWETIEYAGHGPVSLVDGAMHIEQGATLSGARYVGGEILPTTNYEVEVEGRRILGSDCFCFLTFPFRDKHATFVCGGWGGAWIGISSINNMDAYENSTGMSYEFEDGRWYTMRVRCTQNRIQAWINDKEVVSTNVTGKEVTMRFGEIEDSVPLAISTYTVTGEARNLRLRKLTPEEIAAAEKLNEDDEF